MKRILLIILALPRILFSQECDCMENYKWLRKTFEQNDAGFQTIIDLKGYDAYEKFNDSIESIVKDINNINTCQNVLNSWTHFFRKGHIGVNVIYTRPIEKDENLTKDEIIKKYANTEKINYQESVFRKYLENSSDDIGIEGIWRSGNYELGIIRDTLNPLRDYIGFIIRSKIPQWQTGQIKIEFYNENSGYSNNYYMLDHSIEKFELKQVSSSKIEIGSITLIRFPINVESTDSLDWELLTSKTPLIKEISNDVVILRIPSFFVNKKYIDRILSENHKLIVSHPNLIIDIRNNNGGYDISFNKIIPYLYTNPIKLHGVEYLSTPINNKVIKERSKYSLLGRLLFKISEDDLNNSIGGFVNIGFDSIFKEYKKVYKYPSNVALLINGNCVSAAEQFILTAKQSKKVKIYGQTSFGALDVSNVNYLKFPDNRMKLTYGMSRTLRSKYLRIDDIGINPDYFIDDSIPEYKWINIVLDDLK